MKCLICEGTGEIHEIEQRHYGYCSGCQFWWLSPSQRLSFAEEQSRYLLHEYSYSDKGYREFVGSLLKAIARDHPNAAFGLDYGCGREPVLLTWLQERGYKMKGYDAFFFPIRPTQKREFDFVVCCETVEHFHKPVEEFHYIGELIGQTGILYVQTQLWNPQMDFSKWYYRRDPTHVCFYSIRTMEILAQEIGMEFIDRPGPQVIRFKRSSHTHTDTFNF